MNTKSIENFKAATGLVGNVEKMLNVAEGVDKVKLFNKLSWLIGKGAALDNNDSEYAVNYANALTEVANALELSNEEIAAIPELQRVEQILDKTNAVETTEEPAAGPDEPVVDPEEPTIDPDEPVVDPEEEQTPEELSEIEVEE
jgi:hypothetical protein